jgi:hypothetical protein
MSSSDTLLPVIEVKTSRRGGAGGEKSTELSWRERDGASANSDPDTWQTLMVSGPTGDYVMKLYARYKTAEEGLGSDISSRSKLVTYIEELKSKDMRSRLGDSFTQRKGRRQFDAYIATVASERQRADDDDAS